MNNVNISWKVLTLGIVAGALFGAGTFWIAGNLSEKSNVSQEKKPLYWVAPMDRNYRRDAPGKSPMGMDLVPVYEEQSSADSPGTVAISASVSNNIGVRTQAVVKKSLQTEIRTVGYVQYNEDTLVRIHPRISGWIEKLYVKASGDPVKKDQPLYEIYSPELVNAQEELLLALQRNNQSLIRAAENRLHALQIDVKTIDALKKNRQVKQTITVYSPRQGIVDNLNVREGFYVKPETSMMQIGSLDDVWVQGEIFERQTQFVKSTMMVTMTLDYLPGQTWDGQVDYIYPMLDQQTRTTKVRMRFSNPDHVLKPNMFAQIVIHSNSDEPTLLIPKQALIRTAGSNRVVVSLGNGKFKSVAVTVGNMDENHIEIKDGLKAGDEVVVSAQFLLDSESNISSDLLRMESTRMQSTGMGDDHQSSMPGMNMSYMDTEKTSADNVIEKDVVWVNAEINELMPQQRTINITHDPIPQWQWPEMTMNFDVAENVDMEKLNTGDKRRVHIQKTDDGRYVVIELGNSQSEGTKP